MKTYLLNYKCPNTFTFQNSIKVPNERNKLSKLLIAGVNEITEDEWEQIKDHPALPEMFNSDPEKLEWVEGRGPEDTVHETPESGNILSSMTEKQAIKVIRGTLSKDLLDKWYLSESRSTVKAEIEKQFDKLKMPEEKK